MLDHTFDKHFLDCRFSPSQTGMALFVTSTFGNGDPPRSAEKMAAWIDQKINLDLKEQV